MRRYGILHPLLLSFFSRSLYRDVGRTWKGIGFLYLLLLLALSWVLVTIHLHRMVSGLATSTQLDRKSTRLNSSHLVISYAVFCLKKKKIRVLTSVVTTSSMNAHICHRQP